MTTVLSIITLFFIVAAILPHIPGQHWLIRVWEFPRLQQAFILLVLTLVWTYWYIETPLLALCMQAGAVCALLYQLAWVIPYTPVWRTEVNQVPATDDDRTISILTSNVLMTNDNYDALINLTRQRKPDILVTLESNKDWEQALTVLHDDYPYRLSCPLENLYGMHLYSRRPFGNEKIRFIIEDDVPSMEIWQEMAGTQVKIHFVHPKPPSPTENKSAGPRDKELTRVGKEMAKLKQPAIVTGDLNDVAWSPTTRKFRKISGMLDPRRGRGFFNTFHADYPLLRWPLDHVFHTEHFELVKIERMPDVGSDHFPLLTTLRLRTSPSVKPA